MSGRVAAGRAAATPSPIVRLYPYVGNAMRFSVLIPLLLVGVCSTFTAAPAWSQIYKWVNDRGVVNYSNQPPANRKAKALDLSAITVSVYEAEKPGQRAAAPARSEVASLSDKIDRLERQLEAERQAGQYAASANARALQAADDQCVAERRVDCNSIYNGFYPYGLTIVFVPRFRRIHVAPIFPVTTGNVTAGNFTTFSTSRPLAVARIRGLPIR